MEERHNKNSRKPGEKRKVKVKVEKAARGPSI